VGARGMTAEMPSPVGGHCCAVGAGLHGRAGGVAARRWRPPLNSLHVPKNVMSCGLGEVSLARSGDSLYGCVMWQQGAQSSDHVCV